MKRHLESQKSYRITKTNSSPEVAELTRQYHITSGTNKKRLEISIKLDGTKLIQYTTINYYLFK